VPPRLRRGTADADSGDHGQHGEVSLDLKSLVS